MKIVVWTVIRLLFGTVVFSAPVAEDVHQEPRSLDTDNNQVDYQRDRRLDNDYYSISPCAGSSSSNMPVATFVPDALYQSNFGPMQARYFTSEYGHPDYSESWYRTEDPYKDNREIVRYSDTDFVDQTPMGNIFRSAPSSYMHMKGANIASFNGQMANQIRAAYGIFPNANVGDCNVPLLFSCTPSIVTGRIENPDAQVDFDNLSSRIGKPLHTYRGVNGHYPNVATSHVEQTENDHASISSSINNNVQKNNVL